MLLQHFVDCGQGFERQILNFNEYQCKKNEVNEECYSEFGAYFMSCNVTCLIFLYIHLHFQHVEAISCGISKVLACFCYQPLPLLFPSLTLAWTVSIQGFLLAFLFVLED